MLFRSDVPLRERNALLLAGGYAPAYPEHSLEEPELTRLRTALRQILTGHEPYPALVVNRWWEMLDGNAAVAVPLRLRRGDQELAFFSMTAIVGAPLDVTVAEVAIESFYPADAETATALQAISARAIT